jgi:hypothetical protein
MASVRGVAHGGGQRWELSPSEEHLMKVKTNIKANFTGIPIPITIGG